MLSMKNYGDSLLNVEKLVSDIAATGKPSATFPDADAIVTHLSDKMSDGDVVAVMSNGGFGGIHDKLLKILAAGHGDNAPS